MSSGPLKTKEEVISNDKNDISATLWTSLVTMLVATLLLIGVFVLAIMIFIKIKHIPTRAVVHKMVSDRIIGPKQSVTAGGVAAGFW